MCKENIACTAYSKIDVNTKIHSTNYKVVTFRDQFKT